MPCGLVLHEGDAFAFDRMGNQRGRLTFGGRCFRKCGAQGIKVMAVHIDDVPAECLKLLIQRFRTDDILCGAVDLKSVDIDDCAEVVALVMRCRHGSFPDFAFFAFAVAHQAVDAVIIAGAFVLRGLMLTHQTLDYQDFLKIWVDYFRDNGGWKAIAHPIGNYNVPYLYFLALISYVKISDLYLIKLFSIVFDVLLAWSVMRIVEQFTSSNIRKMAAFFVALYLPTVLLNGSYWGQCDSIYAAFAVMALDQALRDRPAASMILFACSFAFKLQAVFILPMILVLIIHRRMKWWHLILFPITYGILVFPAVYAGLPINDAIMLYLDQMGTVGQGLNYNSPSVYTLIGEVANKDFAGKMGIVMAAISVCGILLMNLRTQYKSERKVLCSALLMAIAVPLFLPHMHERYFFLADILSLTAAFAAPAYFLLPFLLQFASLLGYHAYLKGFYLYPMYYGTLALFAALILSLIWYYSKKKT